MASKVKFYNAWYCPFAQRLWIALNFKGIDFEYIEQDPYNKSPEWLQVNPLGLVPTLVDNGNSIYESSVCLEYVEDRWPSKDPSESLLPEDPFKRAYARMWGDFISKKVIPLFYKILMNTEPSLQVQHRQDFLNNIEELQQAMDEEGPYFLGSCFSNVDIMLMPHAWRMTNVVPHYRDFHIPDTARFERYFKWWDAVKGLGCFTVTLPSVSDIIEEYKRYASNTTNSQVAEATRKGGILP